MPTKAEHSGRVWAYDFAYDRTEIHRVLKLLILLDEYRRECHEIRVGYSLNCEGATETLEGLFEHYGASEYIRSDDGGDIITSSPG